MNKVIRDNPANTPKNDLRDCALLRALAAIQSHFGNQDAAAKVLSLAEWLGPDDLDTVKLRALIEMRRGRLEDAFAAIVQMKGLGYDVPEALMFVESRMQAATEAQDT